MQVCGQKVTFVSGDSDSSNNINLVNPIKGRPENERKETISNSIRWFCERPVQLSDNQIALLKEAKSTDYDVKVLEGSIDNRYCTVVLLGECHLKNKSASRIGVNLLKEFPVRGLEGMKLGRTANICLDGIYIPVKLVCWITSRNCPSTIDEAEKIKADVGETKNIELEPGDDSGILDNIFVAMFIVLIFPGCLLCGLVGTILRQYNQVEDNPVEILFYCVSIIAFVVLGQLSSILKHKSNHPFEYYILDDRNYKMCEKIIKIFHDMPTEQVMLAITGKDHTEHMAQILEKDYGFKVINNVLKETEHSKIK